MDKIIQISSTADNKDLLESLANDLIARKLIACAQIMGPIKSIYRWKGKVENTEEWLIIMKSRASLYPAVEQRIRVQHPYEVPEITAVDVTAVLPDYSRWILDETKEHVE